MTEIPCCPGARAGLGEEFQGLPGSGARTSTSEPSLELVFPVPSWARPGSERASFVCRARGACGGGWPRIARKAKPYERPAVDREAEGMTVGHLPISRRGKIRIFELLTSNGLCKKS